MNELRNFIDEIQNRQWTMTMVKLTKKGKCTKLIHKLGVKRNLKWPQRPKKSQWNDHRIVYIQQELKYLILTEHGNWIGKNAFQFRSYAWCIANSVFTELTNMLLELKTPGDKENYFEFGWGQLFESFWVEFRFSTHFEASLKRKSGV